MEINVSSLDEWGRVFTDAIVWRPLVEAICRRHGIAVETVRAGYPGGNAVFIVNDAAVVKISCPFFREWFAAEQEVTARVAERTDLPVPRVLAQGVIDAGAEWPYFVMSFVAGERIGDVWGELSEADRCRIAESLGRMTRVLHEIPLEGLRHLDTTRDGWARFVKRQIDGCVARHAKRSLPPHLLAQVPDFLASLDLTPPQALRLLNADITEDHVLLAPSPRGWEIVGLIDSGDAMVGDPEYEFVALALGALAEDRAAFRHFLTAYGVGAVDPAFNGRMLGWTLLHRFWEFHNTIDRLGGPDAVRRLEELQDALWGE